MIRRALVSVAAGAALVGLAACSRPDPELELDEVRSVSLTLTLREAVAWRGREPAKELRLSLRGTPERSAEAGDGGPVRLALAVDWAELSYVAADGSLVALATDGTRDEPVSADALTRARRGIIEELVGCAVRVVVADGSRAAGGGVRSVDGLASALSTARGAVAATTTIPVEVIAAAADGLEPLLDDEAVSCALAAAGLGPAAPEMRTPGREVRRPVRLHVAGCGWTVVDVFGRSGVGRGGSPTVRLVGELADGAAFSGDAGDEPPPGVGPVRLADVGVSAQTEYDPRNLRPLQGSLVLEMPHEAGPLVTRTTEFVLVVAE